jgi:hypothetical protein
MLFRQWADSRGGLRPGRKGKRAVGGWRWEKRRPGLGLLLFLLDCGLWNSGFLQRELLNRLPWEIRGDHRCIQGRDRKQGRERLLSQENGPFQLRERAGIGTLHPSGAGHDHLLQHTIEWGIEKLTAAIQQLKKEGIASGFPALEPDRRLPVHEHALTIKGDS